MIIEVLRVRVNVHGPRKLTVYRQRTRTLQMASSLEHGPHCNTNWIHPQSDYSFG